MRRTRTRTLLIGLVGSAMLLTACGGDDTADGGDTPTPAASTPADEESSSEATDEPTATETSAAGGDEAAVEELVAACQDEGKLTFYGSPTENQLIDLSDAFTAKYEVPVEFVRLAGNSLRERFLAETAAGTWVPDVVLTTDDSASVEGGFYYAALQEGVIVDLREAGIPGVPGEFPEEFFRETRAVVQIQPWGFSFNTDIVDDPPLQWPDVNDGRFTDLVLLPDPVSSNAYIQVFLVVLDEYGEEWFEAFRAQNARVFESGVPATEALGAGEGGIEFPSLSGLVVGAQDRGVPLDLTIPDVTTGVEMGVGLPDPTKTDHPNCGKLFIHYVMSEEGSAVFSDYLEVYSPYDTGGLPSGYVSPADIGDEQIAQVVELLGTGG